MAVTAQLPNQWWRSPRWPTVLSPSRAWPGARLRLPAPPRAQETRS